MKLKLLVAISALFLTACSTGIQEVPTDKLDTNPKIIHLDGKITNIKEVKKKAAFKNRIGGSMLGALIGGQIGGGSGKEIAGVTGAFLGIDLANDKYGKLIDHIYIEDSNGKTYDCYVHNHIFKLSDKVKFTLVAGHVSAVVLDTE